MGTGANAGEKVENLNEIAAHCAKEYDELQQRSLAPPLSALGKTSKKRGEHAAAQSPWPAGLRYPEFKPKIEQVVGHGIAILRQKTKFRYSVMHNYGF